MIGKVSLVGAGPGDPELLTVKAAAALATADAVVYDRLVGESILANIGTKAAHYPVGKQLGCGSTQQDAINDLLLQLARDGNKVVRLKGGDPFIFGRGGEEMLFLRQHGIPVEVIPGITAAAGCAASLSFPLTHRGMASSVRLVTGHLQDDCDLNLNWGSLVDTDCTLVFYMAVANTPLIVRSLVAHGMPESMPAALVSSGTTDSQRCTVVPLWKVTESLGAFKAPGLLIIGRVVTLAMQSSESGLDQSENGTNRLETVHPDLIRIVDASCATAMTMAASQQLHSI